MSHKPTNPIITVKLAKLHPHPEQARYFTARSEAEEQAFVESLARGLDHPIEILPDDNRAGLPGKTIIAGHRRTKGLMQRGVKEAPAEVRMDLKDADAATVLAALIMDNLDRRQLHPLEKARAVVGLYEAEKKRKPGSTDPTKPGDLRDRVGAMIGMCGKNLQRYLRALSLPVKLQQAHLDGRLKLELAARASALPDEVLADLARTAAKGTGDLNKAVMTYLPKGDGQPVHGAATRTFAAFARALESRVNVLEQVQGRVFLGEIAKQAPILQRARTLFGGLLEKAREYDPAAATAELQNAAKQMLTPPAPEPTGDQGQAASTVPALDPLSLDDGLGAVNEHLDAPPPPRSGVRRPQRAVPGHLKTADGHRVHAKAST